MTDDRLLDRLARLDPATPERIAAASGGADDLRRGIETEEIDELAIHRRSRRRRLATVIVAAAVTAALLVPLILLLPLGDDDTSTIGTAPSTTATTEPTASSGPTHSPVAHGPLGPIDVQAPPRGAVVTSPVTINGTADVFEATVSIRIIDAVNNPIAQTITMATCGTGCRGDFSVDVPFSVDTEQTGVIQVFEVSAKDGSMIHVVRIHVTLVPGGDDPVATAVEGVWCDPYGDGCPTAVRRASRSYSPPSKVPSIAGGRRSRS
jgi:Immunoglobulin-like domain of bacterial spore germination